MSLLNNHYNNHLGFNHMIILQLISIFITIKVCRL
nr:MAG TPA: hypothetical protein [Caudoviricetes sp.]